MATAMAALVLATEYSVLVFIPGYGFVLMPLSAVMGNLGGFGGMGGFGGLGGMGMF